MFLWGYLFIFQSCFKGLIFRKKVSSCKRSVSQSGKTLKPRIKTVLASENTCHDEITPKCYTFVLADFLKRESALIRKSATFEQKMNRDKRKEDLLGDTKFPDISGFIETV